MTRIEIRFERMLSPRACAAIRRVLRTMRRRAPAFFKRASMPRSILILFVALSVSRKLNRIYRKKNKPTNVLSFVYDAAYAEIFITPAVVKKEAALSGETLEHALVKLIIHGIIHCSGKDHEISATEERAFESLEQKLFERAYGAGRRAYRHSKR